VSAPERGGTTTYLEAIRQGLWEEMEGDDRVFLLGEDVGVYGGAFKVTDGFLERFGEARVVDTPISEAAIVGASVGAAMMGLRPVAEMQFIDFISCGFDQLTNVAAKNRYRWGQPTPIVVRGPAGGGAFHSLQAESYFAHTAGLKVVCPATPYDAKGLIKAAIRDDDPVIFQEHKFLYRRIKEDLPAEDFVVPLGKARTHREGKDLSILTWAAMVHTAAEAAEALAADGVEVEIVDLRTLVPLDEEAILRSVAKTSRAIVLHEAPRTGGFGGEIAATIAEKAFEYLDAPIVRVTAPDTPVPYSPPLEEYYLPGKDDLLEAARKLLDY